MPQPFQVGSVVGGRYRVTHHVVTSADQDIVFQGIDEVLDREVSILLAAKSNAKQVATSARELAAGERSSEVQILDLGLAKDQTYLIASQTDPNLLLDLVVPDAGPYVEPFFTDSLGSEIFGQSRVMEPETYDDDAEYYANLQGTDLDAEGEGSTGRTRKRPAFLDKVSDSLNRRLGTGRESAPESSSPASSVPEQGVSEQGVPEADYAHGAPAGSGGPDSGGSYSGSPETSDPESSRPEFSGSAPGPAGNYARQDVVVPAEPELVEADSNADSAEEFGVESDETGVLRPTGTIAAPGDPEVLGTAGVEAPPAVAQRAPMVAGLQEAYAAGGSAETAAHGHGAAPADPYIAGEEVIDDPPESPVEGFERRAEEEQVPVPNPAETAGFDAGREEQLFGPAAAHGSFTGLIKAVPPHQQPEQSYGAAAGPGGQAGYPPSSPYQDAPAPQEGGDKPGMGKWLGAGILGLIVLVAAVVMFFLLPGGLFGDDDETSPEETAQEQTEEGTEESPEEGTEEAPEDEAGEDTPEAVVTSLTREVPDSPDLNAEADGNLPNAFDGSTDTSWNTFNYGSAQFGGFASNMALIAELEESVPLSEVTLVQLSGSGGSFEILVNDQPGLDGATAVGSGSFEGQETTVSIEDDAEGQYVILNITELPQHDSPEDPGLPYGLHLADFSVN